MPAISTVLLTKLALSGGISTLSKLLDQDEGAGKISNPKDWAKALNSVLGDVAPSFLQKYASDIKYQDLTRFINNEEQGYEELNHDIEKLMIKSVGETFKYLATSYKSKFEINKNEIAFLLELEKQAKVRPNDESDYKLIAQNKESWLEKNINYAWIFVEQFIEDKNFNTSELHLDFIKEYISKHFYRAYEIVFFEGLKNPADEKPYKAFIIKTLKGLGEQINKGQDIILKRLAEFEKNTQKYLRQGQSFLDQKWFDADKAFKKEVIDRLVDLHNVAIAIDSKIEVLLNPQPVLIYDYSHLSETINNAVFRRRYIDFVGRETEMQNLKDFFYSHNKNLEWLLITGAGGSGKSRLAMELCFEIKKENPNYVMGFYILPEHESINWQKWQPTTNTLIVIDYVASTSEKVLKILKDLNPRIGNLKFPVRFLLLERDQSENWWKSYENAYDHGNIPEPSLTLSFLLALRGNWWT